MTDDQQYLDSTDHVDCLTTPHVERLADIKRHYHC
jgi:hypothetical protein